MRRKAKQEYWYVLVFTNKGPKYVTKTGEHKTAYWNEKEKPLELSKDWAQQMSLGLCLNGYNAIAIGSIYEVVSHPYNYEDYSIVWRKKKGKKNENNA